MVGVPEKIRWELRSYWDLFRRAEGFEHVRRYVTGLIVVSPNKTLQETYAGQGWEGEKPSRHAMHEAVFKAEGAEELPSPHRVVIALEQRGPGREVLSLDWRWSTMKVGHKYTGRRRAMILESIKGSGR